MDKFLLVETQSSFDGKGVETFFKEAVELAKDSIVDVFLIENGVMLVLENQGEIIEPLLQNPNINIWIDEFSLEQKNINPEVLPEKIGVVGVSKYVDMLLEEDRKNIWHA